MIVEDLHQPVTNGKTKKMVAMSIIFIFIITMTSLFLAFYADFGLLGLFLWLTKGSFGTISLGGLGALIGVTKKFFDTRTSEIKASDKLLLKKENHNFKIQKLEMKNKYKK